jgi:antitoxin VapB
LERIFETIKPGETEREIARSTKNALAKRGIESVVTLVGADERIDNFRHPVPTENVWKKVLLIAVCARRAGLIASLSRIALVGAIPDELRRKTEAATYVFGKFLAATEPGANSAAIYEIASKAYAEKGFADEIDKHHQGGAAGYKTRDWVAHPASAEIVQNNQAFAWNPSITGTKAEETVIAGENGIEYLTLSPNFPRIEIAIDGNEFYAPDILKL